jgi:hypothetical protein
MIATILNAIEDEHSGVAANPSAWQSDGRMYPPQSDMARPSTEWPSVMVYRSRSRRTLIGTNGAFAITDLATGLVPIEKPGSDGLRLPTASPKSPPNPS